MCSPPRTLPRSIPSAEALRLVRQGLRGDVPGAQEQAAQSGDGARATGENGAGAASQEEDVVEPRLSTRASNGRVSRRRLRGARLRPPSCAAPLATEFDPDETNAAGR